MPRLFRVILPVSDIDRAAVVYADLLGISGTRVSGGRHYFDCGGTILACYDAAADGDGPVEPTRYQTGQYLYFAVPDVDATHAAAVRLGFAVEQAGVQSMPWGERVFWATDPFGNPVSFVAEGTVFTG
jgi:predicted enzyme related to lactoylglutathione lyase